MKNTTIILGIILVLVLMGSLIINGSGKGDTSNKIIINNQSELQKVTLSVKDYNYYPNTITVKSGIPVRLTLDSSVRGCLRSFTIKDLGVSKISKTPSETIDFTPAKKGTFKFACSMGMGYGTIIVE